MDPYRIALKLKSENEEGRVTHDIALQLSQRFDGFSRTVGNCIGSIQDRFCIVKVKDLVKINNVWLKINTRPWLDPLKFPDFLKYLSNISDRMKAFSDSQHRILMKLPTYCGEDHGPHRKVLRELMSLFWLVLISSYLKLLSTSQTVPKSWWANMKLHRL